MRSLRRVPFIEFDWRRFAPDHPTGQAGFVLVQNELGRGLLVQRFGPIVVGLGYRIVDARVASAAARAKAAKDWLLEEAESSRRDAI